MWSNYTFSCHIKRTHNTEERFWHLKTCYQYIREIVIEWSESWIGSIWNQPFNITVNVLIISDKYQPDPLADLGETCKDFNDCKTNFCVKCPDESDGVCMEGKTVRFHLCGYVLHSIWTLDVCFCSFVPAYKIAWNPYVEPLTRSSQSNRVSYWTNTVCGLWLGFIHTHIHMQIHTYIHTYICTLIHV